MNSQTKEDKAKGSRDEDGGKTKHNQGSSGKSPILVITGYPRNVKRALFQNYLASYGKLQKCYFYQDHTTVQYVTENTYKTLLQNPLRFEDNFLKVKIAWPNDAPKNKNRNDDENKVHPQNNGQYADLYLINRLKQFNTADEQLLFFLNELQLPFQESKQNCLILCRHLESALNNHPQFKGCQAMPFGSTVTGLAFKGSDLDIFIQVPPRPIIANSTLLAASYVNEARKPLRRSDLFRNIIGITKAKTPIVKCIHRPTGISCDINFKNMLGVCNSALVNFLLGSDIRLRPMMMVIKYWAKINEITGPGKISNYALVMLLIFYLQQKPQPILPSISMLQHPSFEKIIEGWNAGYNYNFYFHTIDDNVIPRLLLGFYEYYSTYEFSMKVISTFTGNGISKTLFDGFESLENIFWRYKTMLSKNQIKGLNFNACMCIQDPFEHNHNLTKSVNIATLRHFQSCCKSAVDICRKAIDTNTVICLLPELCKINVPISESPKENNFEIIIVPNSLLEHTTVSMSNQVNPEEHQRKVWYERVNELLLLILKKVMKFDISLTKVEQMSKTPRTALGTDVHDDIVESFTITCTGFYALHSGRKKLSKKIEKSTGGLKHEIAISDYIIDTYYKNPMFDKNPILEMEIVFMARRKPTRIVLDVKNRNKKLKNHFIQCVQYLQRWLPSWMDKHLQDKIDDLLPSSPTKVEVLT